MLNVFCKMPLWQATRTLAAVAQGKEAADLVIRNVRLINVCTAEIEEHKDIAVSCGRIAYVGQADHCIGEKTVVVDGEGQYAAPGFLDGHIHIESSMLGASEYAKAVIPHGTVGIYPDPHEICNVLGLSGVQHMMKDVARTPLKAMFTMPSCVPAVPGFEDTGSSIGPEEIRESMTWPETVGLGEMMNFPGVLASDERTHAELAETLKADRVITGHYSMPETDRGLNAYIASGIRCCHESTRMEDALAKMRLGMYAQFREGSAWHDLHEVARAITEHRVDTRFATLISDDTHPHTLVEQGHLDYILRRAVEEGINPITAIQMVTINCAQCFRMDHELGSITPGKCADIVLLSDLARMRVSKVWIDGELAAEDGRVVFSVEPYAYPADMMHSMHVKGEITPETFRVPAEEPEGTEVVVRAIEVISARVGDYERHVTLRVQDGALHSDPEQDVLKTVVLERHHETGKQGVGFVKGFGIRRGAMASTVAHDAHNLLVIGTNDEDMALAANELIRCGGGMAVAQDGKILGSVPLPLAGLMNPEKSAEEMSHLVGRLEETWKEIGCTMPSPFMTMALVPLACLPELRLTDRGLVDCTTFQFVPLRVEK